MASTGPARVAGAAESRDPKPAAAAQVLHLFDENDACTVLSIHIFCKGWAEDIPPSEDKLQALSEAVTRLQRRLDDEKIQKIIEYIQFARRLSEMVSIYAPSSNWHALYVQLHRVQHPAELKKLSTIKELAAIDSMAAADVTRFTGIVKSFGVMGQLADMRLKMYND